MPSTMRDEVIRKGIHISSIWISLAYYFLDFETTFVILSFISILFIPLDFLRSRKNVMGAIVRGFCRQLFLDQIFRAREKDGALSGASYMLISAIICITMLSKEVFIQAFTILTFADTAAALVGMKFGKVKITASKTIIGSLTFLSIGLVVALPLASLFGSNIAVVTAALLVTTVAEAFSEKFRIDDNLIIPIAYSASFYLFAHLYQFHF